MVRQTEGWTDGWTLTDVLTDTQIDGQTDRQTDRPRETDQAMGLTKCFHYAQIGHKNLLGENSAKGNFTRKYKLIVCLQFKYKCKPRNFAS